MTRSLSLLALLAAGAANAEPLGLVPLQGQVTDDQGVPVEGNLPVTVDLRAAGGSGAVLWSSARTASFEGGAFTLYLGEVTPLDLALFVTNPDAALVLTVDGDALEAVPLAHTPLAAYAAHAATADRAATADFATAAGDAATLDGRGASDFLPSTYAPAWTDLTGVPAELADGDADTTYAAGSGLTLAGTTFEADQAAIEGWAQGVCVDSEAEIRALVDDDYLPATYVPDWSALTGVPTDLADGDADTTYAAGTGLSLLGTTFEVDQVQVELWAEGVSFHTEDELHAALDDDYLPADHVPDWTDLTSVPPDLADGDDDTTYAAGTGLRLTDTTFEVDQTQVEDWAVDAVDAEGAYVRQPARRTIQPTLGRLERVCDSSDIVWHMPDGTTDTVNVAGMTAGEFRMGAGEKITFYYGGTEDSSVYLDLTAFPGQACTLLHDDDDRARPGWYYATDHNRDDPLVFPTRRPIFELRREGSTEAMILACQQFSILCF